MEKERDDYLQAGAYERTSDRRDYRNGYYERDLLIEYWKNNLEGTYVLVMENFQLPYLKDIPGVIKLLFFLCLKWL